MAGERDNPPGWVTPFGAWFGAHWKEPLCRAGMLGAWFGMLLSFLMAIVVIECHPGAPGLRGRLGSLAAPAGGFRPSTAIWVFVASIPFLVGCNLLMLAGRRRLKKRLRIAGGLLCPACHYDLSTLDADTRCPECGRVVGATAVRSYWAASGLWQGDGGPS